MKQIEEGCRAVIVNSKAGNNGKIVKVGVCLGKIDGFYDGTTAWSIDRPIRHTKGNAFPHCREDCLQRIDDDSNQKTRWEELKDDQGNIIWNPTKETA